VKRFSFSLTIQIVLIDGKFCFQETKLFALNRQPLLTGKPLPEMLVGSHLSGSPTYCGKAHPCILCKGGIVFCDMHFISLRDRGTPQGVQHHGASAAVRMKKIS
jgi:hypothetical protein